LTSSPSGSKSSRSPAPRLTGDSTSWMNSCTTTEYPIASSQTWAPTSTITSSGSTVITAGSTSGTFQSPIHGPTDKSSAPMGWYSMLSKSDYTMLPTQEEASGSRNYPMHSGAAYSTHLADGTVTLLPSLRLQSYSTCRRHVGFAGPLSNTTRAYLKTAGELTSTDSKKLTVPPSSNQQGTSRVSDATTIATSRNAP
jgi:hypothetical protein